MGTWTSFSVFRDKGTPKGRSTSSTAHVPPLGRSTSSTARTCRITSASTSTSCSRWGSVIPYGLREYVGISLYPRGGGSTPPSAPREAVKVRRIKYLLSALHGGLGLYGGFSFEGGQMRSCHMYIRPLGGTREGVYEEPCAFTPLRVPEVEDKAVSASTSPIRPHIRWRLVSTPLPPA